MANSEYTYICIYMQHSMDSSIIFGIISYVDKYIHDTVTIDKKRDHEF